jgi:hypothetical protein
VDGLARSSLHARAPACVRRSREGALRAQSALASRLPPGDAIEKVEQATAPGLSDWIGCYARIAREPV